MNDDLKAFVEAYEKAKASGKMSDSGTSNGMAWGGIYPQPMYPSPCPGCGRCPVCGRREASPSYPYYGPYYVTC